MWDNGSFEIGAITPSFTADYRNTRINATSGAWFNISNEFANPLLLSQKNKDLTINFYKLISRNRFYIPIPRGTIALSLVGGVEDIKKGIVRAVGDATQRFIEDRLRICRIFRCQLSKIEG